MPGLLKNHRAAVANALVLAARDALVSEVQPGWRDVVHTVWPNGPTHSGQLSIAWPPFSKSTEVRCKPSSGQAYTGYTDSGDQYCMDASDALDENAHLMMYSGHFGIVFDVNVREDNFMPFLGALGSQPSNAMAPLEVHRLLQSLPRSSLTVGLALNCGGQDSFLRLRPSGPASASAQLVRQGHTLTHVAITDLEWVDENGASFFECPRTLQPNSPGCVTNTGGRSKQCTNPDYPDCLGFEMGKSYGKCHSACPPVPYYWLELTMWGDLATVQLEHNGVSFGSDCSGTVTVAITTEAVEIHQTAHIADPSGTISVRLGSGADGKIEEKVALELGDIEIAGNGAQVEKRPSTQDVFVIVPLDLPRCGYETCDEVGTVTVSATNKHESEARALRLSLSRNFPKLRLRSNQPGAEITGLSIMLVDQLTDQPTGIPLQISKNWHGNSDSDKMFAGYAGTWWTANVLLRLPPDSSYNLKFFINYETYGGVPAYSHAQLSIVGYSNRWLWQESALGTGGENFVFDPLGSHSRATITDVRVKLWDGDWKDNVGGGEMFPTYFDEAGRLQYFKSIDALIHTSGPCLSNASYAGRSQDDALDFDVSFLGGRTDDFVRVFFHVKIRVLKATKFSRLAFFQAGSENYNMNAGHRDLVIGAGSSTSHSFKRECNGGMSRSRDKMYVGGPVRETMPEHGPWWYAFSGNSKGPKSPNPEGKVGDRGLVVRTYEARLGGVARASPSFSVLCDKIELGPPSDVDLLMEGDYVDMHLEMIVLPTEGADYQDALSRKGSKTLQALASQTTVERVRAHALANPVVVPLTTSTAVESNYPVRVRYEGGSGSPSVRFRVEGGALGFLPVVICGLSSHELPSDVGLWIRELDSDDFRMVRQSEHSGADYYQVNYDRITRSYEAVFNIELPADGAEIAFGTGMWAKSSSTKASSLNGAGGSAAAKPGDGATCNTEPSRPNAVGGLSKVGPVLAQCLAFLVGCTSV